MNPDIKIKELEKEIRILKKKVERQENNIRMIDVIGDKSNLMIRTLHEANQKIEDQNREILSQQKILDEQRDKIKEYRQLFSRNFEKVINYFTISIFGKNTVEEILWDLAKNCISELGFIDCIIYLVDDSGEFLIQKAALGPKNPKDFKIFHPISIPMGKGIVGSVAVSGRAEIVNDLSMDPRYIVDDEVRQSEITIPIIYENKVIGIIDSEHHEKDFFNTEHLEVLTTIASLCSNKIARVIAQEKLELLNRELEQRVMARTKELALLNSEKDEFLGIAAHDLKNPLASMMMGIEFIVSYFDQISKEKVTSRLNQMKSSVQYMHNIVTNLLDINAIETGNLQLNFVQFDLNELVEKSSSHFLLQLNEKQIKVIYNTASDLKAWGDHFRMMEILDNLISNALKYSYPKNRIWISSGEYQEECFVEIRDEGPGISEDDQKRLYGKFQRLSAKPTGGEKSTGLGLSIVKKLVDAMNGRIVVESKLNSGASFKVYIPRFKEKLIEV